MRDHGPDDRPEVGDRELVPVGDLSASPASRDLVFDFSELDPMRVQDLSVLLTARQLAFEEDRTVWVTGVPLQTWHTLQALGLSGYFRPFPTRDARRS